MMAGGSKRAESKSAVKEAEEQLSASAAADDVPADDADSPQDAYAVLGVPRAAPPDEVRRAFRRLALRLHPDKLAGRPPAEVRAATLRFQRAADCYAVLADPARRAHYDRTGELAESGAVGGDDWLAALSELWEARITPEQIDAFKREYQGSDEERADVLAAYTESKGSMPHILEVVMCSTLDDEPRFREIVSAAVSEKRAPRHAAFFKAESAAARSKRRRAADAEAREAEQHARDLGLGLDGSDAALAKIIRERASARAEDLVASIEAKYGRPHRTKKKK